MKEIKNHLNGIKKEALKELEKAKREFKKKTITLVLGGFGLVAALAWNEAIKSLFETIFPKKSNALIGKFIYAIIITFIVVFLSLQLKKISEEKE